MMKKLGFTMIELLVVIAVIGILAVALLATLNPLEQIRKGRDTGTRADASQLISALERYNASIGYFPWEGKQANPKAITFAMGDLTSGTAMRTDDADCPGTCLPDDVLGELTNTSEVKASFVDKLTGANNPITLSYVATVNASVYACFLPESNTFSREAFDRCKSGVYGADFTKANACPDATYGTTDEFSPTDADEMICLP